MQEGRLFEMNNEQGQPERRRAPSAAQRRDAARGLGLLTLALLGAGVIFLSLRIFCGFCLIEDGKLQLGNSSIAMLAAALLGIAGLIAVMLMLVGTQQRRWRMRATIDPPDDTTEATTCAACGTEIAAGEYRCTKCGWSYRTKD